MSNAELIIATLQKYGELDDDALCLRSGVTPRQQVNQICNRLERKGVLKRFIGSRGKIVNRLSVAEAPSVVEPPSSKVLSSTPPKPADHTKRFELQGDHRRTLFIIPCSKKKVSGGEIESDGQRISDSLPDDIRQNLFEARKNIATLAGLNEAHLLPAHQRYMGHFYVAARDALAVAVQTKLHVLILSGGYGVVHAAEPIGNYDRVFNPKDWPNGILANVLAAYVHAHGISSVRAILSSSTSYRKVIDSVDWKAAGIKHGMLVSPNIVGGGAMIKAPRAEGEALSALLAGTLSQNWRSGDSVSFQFMNMVA